MATIVKTDSGTWKALVRKTGWPSASKTFRVKRDAQDWARQIEDQMIRSVYIRRTPSEKMSIKEAFERYEREVSPTKKASTQKREELRVKLLKEKFGQYSLAALTSDIVADYRDQRLATGKSNNTVRLELALLGHLYSTAIKEWHIALPANPVANIRKPSPGAGRNVRLNRTEQQRLLIALQTHSNPMLAWIFQVAIETGMRQGEILNLKIQHVDTERRIVSLFDTKNGMSRTVPLTKLAVEVFKEALENPARPNDCELIFFGEPGRDKKRSPYQFNKVWMDVKKSIGLGNLHFHDLRHEATSRLVEAGLSDQEVASISGHKSMQMLRRYTHLRAEDLVAKLDKIEDIVG
ncbi:site-specific recombinase XerD [Methylovorus glucosotrophus]|uniref:site-specific integrase n=1 Tax=Methylovorus glucosotrophus TaxID=266009 RepID=UPI001331B9C4|nr:site-specific integrase [Methylovorus glucosotrophus]KAF0843123.1 site-specific recombinase XerD [Methylovorus glucosotrophus]